MRLARFLVHHRLWCALFLIFSTLFFLYPTVNLIATATGHPLPGPIVRVDATARAQWPSDHKFVHAMDQFRGKFGTGSTVVAGVTFKDGTIFTSENLAAIDRITNAMDGVGYDSRVDQRRVMRDQIEKEKPDIKREKMLSLLDRAYPPYPVNHYQVQSLAHRSTQVVRILPDGSISASKIMLEVPETDKEIQDLRSLVLENPPFIYGRLVSLDEKGALVTAGFITDRLNNRETYTAIIDHLQEMKESEEAANPNIEIFLSGEPMARGWILKHASEIALYVGSTVLVTFLLLLVYFRRLHGVLIPFIAAMCTAIWGLGFTGWVQITFDPLILVIPMIITARAVSHTVQMAERFFEDYETILPQYTDGTPEENKNNAKVEAATVAMAVLIIPGTLGIVTDFIGLLVILMTSIQQMRDLAIFGSFWVFCILFTVELLHPIMICYLPPPHDSAHYLPKFMVRFMGSLGNIVTGPVSRWVIVSITVVLLVGATVITLQKSTIGESRPGTALLWPDHDFNIATKEIGERFGGADQLVVYVNGDRTDASSDADPIHRMEEMERWMGTYTDLGGSVSLAPLLRGIWQMNHYGDPKWNLVPQDTGTVRTMVFQLRQSGPPGFLRPFITDDGRDANVNLFYRDHKGGTIAQAVATADAYIKQHPIGEVIIRLDKNKAPHGAHLWEYEKMADNSYYMLGPLIEATPMGPRAHTLTVRVRQDDGTYIDHPVVQANKDGLPEWLETFREQSVTEYEVQRDRYAEQGEFFHWPEALSDWDAGDVNAWYESEEFGIRAIQLNTKDLLVHDLKSVDSTPTFQATSSWTRGVQFVMAGGIMGILGAINDEVERGHVANIVLILFVIYVLQTFTYGSLWSGTIIVIQLSTATMLSLAYMALKGVGLNINTLPVQSVGVWIGVDYAIYIVDRIIEEAKDTHDIDQAIRRTISTTGMAVVFTASTIVGGIATWGFSSLRFQAEMAQLLVILMVINMIGAVTVIPAMFSIIRPKFAIDKD
jgi:predicted RND superfamily exporter protein